MSKFSGNEIVEMAIQIEEKGYDFYKNMAATTSNKKLIDLYLYLAEEEKKHISVFEQLRESMGKIKTESMYNWEEVSLYFKALIETKVFPDSQDGNSLAQELKDEIGAIQISISFEKDSILFFQEMNNLVDKDDRKIIEKLINEEKGHILKLLKIKKEIVTV